MGSVEVFPRKPGIRPAFEGWRVAPFPGTGVAKVREARLEDYAALRALQREAAPYLPPLTLKHLESQRHAFAAGQMVATCDGQVVGTASSLVVAWDEHGAEPTRRALTCDDTFTTHDPAGDTLYGADLVVDGSHRGFAAARALFQARRRLCRRLNVRRIFVTARLRGYAQARSSMSPEAYAMRIVCGDIPDASLRFHMAQGFQYGGILRGHVPEDVESGGHAALLVWLNPLYCPPGPAANAESQRTRRCA